MFLRFSLSFIFFIFFSTAFSQGKEHHNLSGHYAFTSLAGWTIQMNGSDSYAYAPADGGMDVWDENLEFAITDGEGIELNNAFDFYIKTDFPAAYAKFKLVAQGDETINGLQAKWATFTFSAQGTVEETTQKGDSTITALVQALFYVIKKDNTLYLIHGVTEKNLFSKFETPFRTIIRSFRYKE